MLNQNCKLEIREGGCAAEQTGFPAGRVNCLSEHTLVGSTRGPFTEESENPIR